MTNVGYSFTTAYTLYLCILLSLERRGEFYKVSNLKKPMTRQLIELPRSYLHFEGLINYMEVKVLIAVFSPLQFKQTRLSIVTSMLLPVHINSIAMLLSSKQLRLSSLPTQVYVLIPFGYN